MECRTLRSIHADAYLHYLKECIAGLASSYARGKTVSTRPDLRYVIIRRRAGRHGHVAVYNSNEAFQQLGRQRVPDIMTFTVAVELLADRLAYELAGRTVDARRDPAVHILLEWCGKDTFIVTIWGSLAIF